MKHEDEGATSFGDWPRTVSEAVERLIATLTKAEKRPIAGMDESALIDLHFGLS